MRQFFFFFGLLIVLSVTSCRSLSDSPVQAQLSRGKAIYHQGCATTTCHGVNGEGIAGLNGFRDWPLVGELFQSRNPTAQVIFDVVRSGGESALRALTDQQVYDSIAYELSLNRVVPSEVLTSKNAAAIASGAAAGAQDPGSLFPPPGNARLIPGGLFPTLPISVENRDLRLRLTQIARAASIGSVDAPEGGSYLIVVFNLEVLAGQPQDVSPQHLRLATGEGTILAPLEMDLAFPVTRFYACNIQPGHGTATHAIFALPAGAGPGQLRYTLPGRQPLLVDF